MRNRTRTAWGALAVVAALLAGALPGCGGGGNTAPAKADAVVVTYYYLPL